MQFAPSYIDPDNPVIQRLAKESGLSPSSSLLLFVEQAIALDAVAFIGTESRCNIKGM